MIKTDEKTLKWQKVVIRSFPGPGSWTVHNMRRQVYRDDENDRWLAKVNHRVFEVRYNPAKKTWYGNYRPDLRRE